MEKFTIHLDTTLVTIHKAYKNYFGKEKKPTRKEIADWIATMVEADILDMASHEEEENES